MSVFVCCLCQWDRDITHPFPDECRDTSTHGVAGFVNISVFLTKRKEKSILLKLLLFADMNMLYKKLKHQSDS